MIVITLGSCWTNSLRREQFSVRLLEKFLKLFNDFSQTSCALMVVSRVLEKAFHFRHLTSKVLFGPFCIHLVPSSFTLSTFSLAFFLNGIGKPKAMVKG